MSTFVDVLGGIDDTTAYKAPCVAATTADLGTSLTGLLVIDGHQTAINDRILVWKQADQTTNGIYVAQTSAWSRSIDFTSGSSILKGTQVLVSQGVNFADVIFICQQSNPIIGVDDITFVESAQGGGGGQTAAYRNITGGATDTATTSDNYIVWNVPGGAKTEHIPPASFFKSGQTLTIKDGVGDAGLNPITVTPTNGTIEGATSYVINRAHASVTLVADSTNNTWRLT